MMRPEESVLAQLNDWSLGADPRTGGGQAGDGDGVIQYVDQPHACDVYYYSNSNHNTNPYIVCDDFVADGTPLRNIRFFGGTSADLPSDLSRVGIEIWTTTSGGECGWTYDSFVAGEFFSIGEVAPAKVCEVGDDAWPAYDMRATFSSPIPLNAGQHYFITIYGELNNPNGPGLFFLLRSSVTNYNESESLNRISRHYDRCGPYDIAFETNYITDCAEQSCTSNYFLYSNEDDGYVSWIVFDDFRVQTPGDLRQLQFNGGAVDIYLARGALLGNIQAFGIELYTIEPADDEALCYSLLTSFLGDYTVPIEDTSPRFHCYDQFGIPNYQFTVDLPPGDFPLAADTDYALTIYAIRRDPHGAEVFTWANSDDLYGMLARVWDWSHYYAVCIDKNMAFCVNGPAPCLGDFNEDGVANTLDVLAFLNAWAGDQAAADCNADGVINTQDVLCFLNRWAPGC